jgi:hypothetical protein
LVDSTRTHESARSELEAGTSTIAELKDDANGSLTPDATSDSEFPMADDDGEDTDDDGGGEDDDDDGGGGEDDDDYAGGEDDDDALVGRESSVGSTRVVPTRSSPTCPFSYRYRECIYPKRKATNSTKRNERGTAR